VKEGKAIALKKGFDNTKRDLDQADGRGLKAKEPWGFDATVSRESKGD